MEDCAEKTRVVSKQELVVGERYLCNADNFLFGRWDGQAFLGTKMDEAGELHDVRELHIEDKGTALPLQRMVDDV